MSTQRKRRLRLFWPYGHPWGPGQHPISPYGPPGWGGGFGWGRPLPDDEKAYLDDYIEMLKEELAAAEEYRKELEESE